MHVRNGIVVASKSAVWRDNGIAKPMSCFDPAVNATMIAVAVGRVVSQTRRATRVTIVGLGPVAQGERACQASAAKSALSGTNTVRVEPQATG